MDDRTGGGAAAALLRALRFAAERHGGQRRKGASGVPYLHHLIDVASLLAGVGGGDDPVLLQAAVLHDVLEDTDATPDELEAGFGAEVRRTVEEVSDDKSLDWRERKRRQVERAPGLSLRARRIKLADKVANVRDVLHDPPAGWSDRRRLAYVEWAARVVEGCRGADPALERRFDEAAREGRRRLGGSA